MSDDVLARKFGRTRVAVQAVRERAGIPDPDRSKNRWTAAEVALLGTKPDDVVARKIGRDPKLVMKKRLSLGIANRFNPRAPAWSPEELKLLGTRPDEELALQLGRTLVALVAKRRQLRMPMFNPALPTS